MRKWSQNHSKRFVSLRKDPEIKMNQLFLWIKLFLQQKTILQFVYYIYKKYNILSKHFGQIILIIKIIIITLFFSILTKRKLHLINTCPIFSSTLIDPKHTTKPPLGHPLDYLPSWIVHFLNSLSEFLIDVGGLL